MDSDWITSPKQINGINLSNYLPQKRSYNSVVFVHKKCLDKPKTDEEKKDKVKSKKEKKTKQDKGQQSNFDKSTEYSKEKTYKIYNNDNSVLEQTIRFAKNIVPLVLPPSENKSDVIYTVKTAKGHRKKDNKPRHSSLEHQKPINIKEVPKKFVETYRKVKKESYSISQSSNNTLDDLNINQSLCCTFSEISENKCPKKSKRHSKKVDPGSHFAISESFEAVATENMSGDAKLKIHLMNDKDKHFLSDSIKEPILNAIRDCILELHENNQNTEITTVQKCVKCNSQKLDNILDKLACIENKLDSYEKKLDSHKNKLVVHEEIIITHENKLDNHEKNIDTHENSLDIHKRMLDTHENMLDSYARKLDIQDKNMGDFEKKLNVKPEDKRVLLPKVQECKAKASTLEELAEDVIEFKGDYSSEEELHHELLDKRSKSTVVVELHKHREERCVDSLGGGEVPRSLKGGASTIGGKLDRPNRIPARFCWTDAGKKT